jgi:DNA-binding MarR family transcriptional regulator
LSEAARILDCFAALRRALGGEVPAGGSESISVAQLHALRALDEGDRTAGELARAIVVSLPSLTQLADGLVERGYVVRHTDPDDRRKVRLSITASGRELYRRARQAAEARIEDLLQDLSPEQRAALVEGLEALRSAIHAQWLAGHGRPAASVTVRGE